MPTTGAGVGFLSERIVHVHLTTNCNLACAHCYSSSGPAAHDTLDAATLVSGLRALYGEGYQVVSLSGGEPLLYRGLPSVIAELRAIGFRVNLVTNGTVFRSPAAREAVAMCDFTAVSVDGLAERHDAIRGRSGAFRRTELGLGWLADTGHPFGVTCTVTSSSMSDVPDVYDWAVWRGARLLNLRPLALVGRAAHELADDGLSPEDMSRLFVLANVLDQERDPMRVRTDAAPVGLVQAAWSSAFPVAPGITAGWLLSDLVNPLIVTEVGRLFPYAYGVGGGFGLGSIAAADQAADALRSSGAESVHRLLNAARGRLPSHGCIDWHGHLTHVSLQLPDRVPAGAI